MIGTYEFNFEQVDVKRGNKGYPRVKCVWLNKKAGYIGISKDIIEKTAFVGGDEVILLVDKRMGVFCLAASHFANMAGSAKIGTKFSPIGGGTCSLCINSKDMVAKIAILSEQMNYKGDEFDAWVAPDGSVLFKPKEGK